MSRLLNASIFVAIAGFITACSVGTPHVRANAEALKLGSTTYSQVLERFGEPQHVGDLVKNGKPIKSISYSFALVSEEAQRPGIVPARAMTYYFDEHYIFVGQTFESSFDLDSTDFDERKLARIIKGKTTRAEVISLLGKPSGSYIAPMVKATYGEAIGYSNITFGKKSSSGRKVLVKSLHISFNENDQVSDMDFSSTSSTRNF
jgi:hypothetical protein